MSPNHDDERLSILGVQDDRDSTVLENGLLDQP